MNAANNSCSPTIIEYTEFYNIALDHMDLMKVVLVFWLVRCSPRFPFVSNI